jgi:hypothetical protein
MSYNFNTHEFGDGLGYVNMTNASVGLVSTNEMLIFS